METLHRKENSIQPLPLSRNGGGPTFLGRGVQFISSLPQEEQPVLQLHTNPDDLPSVCDIIYSQKCTRDFAILSRPAKLVNGSMDEVRASTRLFPSPQGLFTPQGELCEVNIPIIPELSTKIWIEYGNCLDDVVWMQLERLSRRKHGRRICDQIKTQLTALPGFMEASWACYLEKKT